MMSMPGGWCVTLCGNKRPAGRRGLEAGHSLATLAAMPSCSWSLSMRSMRLCSRAMSIVTNTIEPKVAIVVNRRFCLEALKAAAA
jgi:hypothetical protein